MPDDTLTCCICGKSFRTKQGLGLHFAHRAAGRGNCRGGVGSETTDRFAPIYPHLRDDYVDCERCGTCVVCKDNTCTCGHIVCVHCCKQGGHIGSEGRHDMTKTEIICRPIWEATDA